MDTQTIKQLISENESETIEFKTSTAQLKRAFETICAFLNGEGRQLIIGINDNGKVIGQTVTDKTQKEIANEFGKLEPTPVLEISYVPFNSTKASLIWIKVPRGLHAPYLYDGRAFQRNQSTTVRMSQHRYEQLLIDRGQLNYTWEITPAVEYHIDDLDIDEINKTISDGIYAQRIPAIAQKEDIATILERFGLSANGILNRAAIVLYAKSSALKFTQCMIKMARFVGKNKLGD